MNGCRGGAAACSGGFADVWSLLSAARPAATAAAASTTASATSHSSPATTYTTIMNTGAATRTANASQRRMPRLARNHHAAAQAKRQAQKAEEQRGNALQAPEQQEHHHRGDGGGEREPGQPALAASGAGWRSGSRPPVGSVRSASPPPAPCGGPSPGAATSSALRAMLTLPEPSPTAHLSDRRSLLQSEADGAAGAVHPGRVKTLG